MLSCLLDGVTRFGHAGGAFPLHTGGYFHGMVAKAKAGELNLARTVWGLRQTTVSGFRRGSSHPGTPSCA